MDVNISIVKKGDAFDIHHLSNLIKRRFNQILIIALPAAFQDIVFGFFQYAYWANYYLTIVEILSIIGTIIGLETTFYLFRFLAGIVDNFDLSDILSFFISKL